MKAKKIKTVVIIVLLVIISCLIGFRNELFDQDDSAASHGYGSEIAQITDYGGSVDDKSFNEGAWKAIIEFTNQNGMTRKYYQCLDSADQTMSDEIALAISGGAKVVICPGYQFATPIWKAQQLYPDTWLVLIDGVASNADGSDTTIGDHTICANYADEQAGFLAGYAAVMDGYRHLGFMGGMAVPSVMRYGYGYCAGADYAAQELGLDSGEVTIRYTYTGSFVASPEILSQASSWYKSGTEVIFSCGGAIVNSIMKAAETCHGKVIGVDVDQSYQSETVITSAMKNIANSVLDILGDYQAGTLEGGKSIRFDAAMGCVGLPMETSRFNQFTQEQYDAVYNKLASGEITPPRDDAAVYADELGLDLVAVSVIE